MIKEHELMGYNKYIIYQDDNLYKFNLDSLLLAYFTNIKKSDTKILDIGAANGAISFFLTLKTKAVITAVEIQKELYDLLVKGIEKNNLTKQIIAVNADILNNKQENYYDVVVCNPPYFKVTPNSNLSSNDSLLIAKHEVKLTLQQLINKSFHLLKNKGSINLVHRPERLIEIIELLKINHFSVKRMALVYVKEGENAKNVLIEAVKNGSDNSLEVISPIYLYNEDNSWTNQALEIFKFGEVI